MSSYLVITSYGNLFYDNERFRIMFTANGKHEIHVYVFLRKVQSNYSGLSYAVRINFLRILRNNLMAGQDSIKSPDFGAVEKSHMYVLRLDYMYHVHVVHTVCSLLKIKKKEGLQLIIWEIFGWFISLHEKLILVRVLEIQKENWE